MKKICLFKAPKEKGALKSRECIKDFPRPCCTHKAVFTALCPVREGHSALQRQANSNSFRVLPLIFVLMVNTEKKNQCWLESAENYSDMVTQFQAAGRQYCASNIPGLLVVTKCYLVFLARLCNSRRSQGKWCWC